MADDILKIVTPSETLTITDSPFAITTPGYAPKVPILDPSAVGGLIYKDVLDALSVSVFADTKSAVRSNLQKLLNAFDAADRWWNGDSVITAPVYLQYETDTATYRAVIKGLRDESGMAREWIILPPEYRVHSEHGSITKLPTTFRRGPWLITSESAVATVPTTGKSSEIVTANFASIDQYGVVKVEIEESLVNANLDIANGYLLYSDESDGIQVYEGENFIGSGITATGVSDARGGNVGRINIASTTKTEFNRNTLPVTWDSGQFYIFANLVAASNSFTVQIKVDDDNGNRVVSQEEVITSTTSGVKFFGLHSLPGPVGVVYVDVTPDTASVNLDLDWVILVRANNPAQGAVGIDKTLVNAAGTFIFDHKLLSDRSYGFDTDNGTKPVPLIGSGYIYTRGNQMKMTLIGNGSGTNSYAIEQNSSGNVINLEYTVTRTPINLVPI